MIDGTVRNPDGGSSCSPIVSASTHENRSVKASCGYTNSFVLLFLFFFFNSPGAVSCSLSKFESECILSRRAFMNENKDLCLTPQSFASRLQPACFLSQSSPGSSSSSSSSQPLAASAVSSGGASHQPRVRTPSPISIKH